MLRPATIDAILYEVPPPNHQCRPHGADALSLFIFYLRTARRQGTTRPKATPAFCRKGLNFGEDRFEHADGVLRKLGLREKVSHRNAGIIDGWFVQIHELPKPEGRKSPPLDDPEGGESTPVKKPDPGETPGNAFMNGTLNALRRGEEKGQSSLPQEVLTAFNAKRGTSYRSTAALEQIGRRLGGGYTVEQLIGVAEATLRVEGLKTKDPVFIYREELVDEFVNKGKEKYVRSENARKAWDKARDEDAEKKRKEAERLTWLGEMKSKMSAEDLAALISEAEGGLNSFMRGKLKNERRKGVIGRSTQIAIDEEVHRLIEARLPRQTQP